MRSRLLLLLGALLTGCAAETSNVRVAGPAHLPSPATPAPPVAVVAAPAGGAIAVEPESEAAELAPAEPAGDPYAGFSAPDAALAAAVAQSRASYEDARKAFVAGNIDAAREHFDRAVDVLSAGEIGERADARDLAEAITVQVAAYESAWAGQDEPDPGDEPSVLDTFAQVELPEPAMDPVPTAPVAAHSSRLAGDVPIVVNNQVRAMLEVYRGRLHDEILPAFERSGRYIGTIHEIFREEGVPLDLAWLALVESGFKEHAYSRASAKGLWQFIRSTGNAYGLDVNYWVDERADPIKATRAAARHLKDLHRTFGDWYLALAAYNAGAGKVGRAIQRVGRSDYWAIASSRYLMPETKNYVPAYLTTLLIVEDPAAHGFLYTPALPWAFEESEIEGPADLSVLARCAGTSVDEIRRLNPELRRSLTPANESRYRLRLPLGTRSSFEMAYARVPASERLRFASHTVGKGETVARIANRYGVRADAVVAANGLGRGQSIPAGTELRIPLSDDYYPPSGWSERDSRSSRKRSQQVTWHRVRKGETASGVAARYGVNLSDLRRVNGLSRSGHLIAGSRIRIPGGRSVAAKRPAATARTQTVQHRVRRGETLTAIADRYGVRVKDLARWNGMRLSSNVVAGRTLKVQVAR